MYKYYLKKCGRQELGSVGADGRPHRGRYLLTSMNEGVLSFFPPLSIQQKNDCALLPIVPLFLKKEKIYCNFVYHNDKFHNSTALHPRNEYRIYLNKALDPDNIFCADDIVIMRQENLRTEDGEQIIYLLDLVQHGSGSFYDYLNRIIEDYPINGGYGLYLGILDKFEERANLVKFNDELLTIVDEGVSSRINSSELSDYSRLFSAQSFRDFVLTGYSYLCAITGEAIRYQEYSNLEAAHIKPRSHGGLFLPNNGLALCRDMHWAFDKGFFTLDDEFKVLVHPLISSRYLNEYNGIRIRVPSEQFFAPSLDNIRYHRKHIFGLFQSTGRL